MSKSKLHISIEANRDLRKARLMVIRARNAHAVKMAGKIASPLVGAGLGLGASKLVNSQLNRKLKARIYYLENKIKPLSTEDSKELDLLRKKLNRFNKISNIGSTVAGGIIGSHVGSKLIDKHNKSDKSKFWSTKSSI